MAMDEFEAKLALQGFDLLRYGGLAHVARLGRTRERPCLHDGAEVLDLAQFHGVPSDVPIYQ
jgi:hypothetical protein